MKLDTLALVCVLVVAGGWLLSVLVLFHGISN